MRVADHEDTRSSAEPLPDELSAHRLRRSLIALGVLVAIVVALVAVVPGLGSLRKDFAGADPAWLVLAAVLEVLSCISYVVIFRAVFCRRMPWRTSTEIALAELATNSLISVGGAGGLALGAWVLRRGGMAAGRIARRSVAFFLLTSGANVSAIILAGLGLLTGILHGSRDVVLDIVPIGLGLAGILGALAVKPIAAALARRAHRPRVSKALDSVAAGVEEAIALLRSGDPALYLGAAGYMLFDVAMLGVCFAAFDNSVPPAGVLLLAYLIGQLGGLIPLPAGLGGVDGGLIGTLILYGVAATPAAVAVLAYRALVLWIPALLGVPAMAALRRRVRHDDLTLGRCRPGGELEVVSGGRVRAPSGA